MAVQGARLDTEGGSNRTFMELKFIPHVVPLLLTFCSNRTFMELK